MAGAGPATFTDGPAPAIANAVSHALGKRFSGNKESKGTKDV